MRGCVCLWVTVRRFMNEGMKTILRESKSSPSSWMFLRTRWGWGINPEKKVSREWIGERWKRGEEKRREEKRREEKRREEERGGITCMTVWGNEYKYPSFLSGLMSYTHTHTHTHTHTMPSYFIWVIRNKRKSLTESHAFSTQQHNNVFSS